MVSRVRTAVVGCGTHAMMCILPAARLAPIDLVAACDLSRERAEAAARLFGAQLVLTDFDEVLAGEDIEAVLVTTPASSHAELAVRALEAGRHVFVEKPLADSVEGARSVAEAAGRAGTFLMVGFNKRFAPGYLMAKSAQASSAFGRTLAVGVRYASGNTYPDERSFCYDFAVHALDLLEWFGGRIEAPHWKRAEGRERRWLWTLTARGEGGAVLTATISSAGSWGDVGEEVDLVGEGQRVRCENLVRVTHYRGAEPCWQRGTALDPGSDALVWEPNMLVPNTMNEGIALQGYVREIRHFARSILLGMPPDPGAEAGARAVELAEAMLAAESTGTEG